MYTSSSTANTQHLHFFTLVSATGARYFQSLSSFLPQRYITLHHHDTTSYNDYIQPSNFCWVELGRGRTTHRKMTVSTAASMGGGVIRRQFDASGYMTTTISSLSLHKCQWRKSEDTICENHISLTIFIIFVCFRHHLFLRLYLSRVLLIVIFE
jgi:hypothetical protein